jgi:L-lactate dehydrogenase complex protein LldG
MDETTNKEKLLKSIRNALLTRLDNPFQDIDLDSPVYPAIEESADIRFAMEFIRVGGKFVYCANEEELERSLASVLVSENLMPAYTPDEKIRYVLAQQGIDLLRDAGEPFEIKTTITQCEFLIARTGSILMSSRLLSGRRLHAVPDVHIVVAGTSQIVTELKEALSGIRDKYAPGFPSQITVVTGPSRTADIEKTLVMGAHGPLALYLFLVEDVQL